jgi:glucose-1-phosphate adenylyltransferase
MLERQDRLFSYRFEGYWVKMDTVHTYWQANMDLLQSDPPLKLQDSDWCIHTRNEERPPVNISNGATVSNSLVTHGCTIHGRVENSVLSPGVRVRTGAVVRDSVVFSDCDIGPEAIVERAVLDKNVVIGEGAHIGLNGDWQPRANGPATREPRIALIGRDAHIPDGGQVQFQGAFDGALTQDAFVSAV